MKSKKLLFTLASSLALVSLVGCEGGTKYTGIALDEHLLEVIVEDSGYYALSATVEGSGKKFSEAVVWSSDNEEVVKVDEEGVLEFLKTGSATVTARPAGSKKLSDSCIINVIDPYVTSIELSSVSAYLVVTDDPAKEVEAYVSTFHDGTCDTTVTWSSSNEGVAKYVEDEEGGRVEAVAEGKATITAKAGEKSIELPVVVAAEGSPVAANGGFSYVDSPAEDRTAILGILEKWAVDNNLTGISVYGNGGYSMYSETVQKGTETYIPGYGFGSITEGTIIDDLSGEENSAWKRYYHTYETSDPSRINYMNDKGAVVGDLIGYVSAGYFDTEMNATKDGYQWVGDLSTANRPIAQNATANGKATIYRIPLKVGSALKYATSSSKISAFNGREVELEDYLTPYKIYYTQAFGQARGSENLEGASSIKGAKKYYEASKNGFDAAAFAKLGIKTYTDGEQVGLEFEFNTACTPFYAMYYLTSSMFAPVPAEFINTLGGGTGDDVAAASFAAGVKLWGENNEDLTESPADHWLCTGPFTFEKWEAEKEIVFKKNDLYADRGRYQVEGIHINILKAMNSDKEAALNEFLAGKLSACGIPSTKLEQYMTDPRTVSTKGDSNFKLNVNTCNDDEWEKLFGEEGSITQTPRSQYWECEPALANKNFVDAISYAINRAELAATLGRTTGFEYFADVYLSDPENGVSYNSTQAHKDAIAAMLDGTEFGYSLEKAKAAFKTACEELIASGAYKPGDTIEIELAWQSFSDETELHAYISDYLHDAFDECGGGLNLKTVFWASETWSDVYYKKMMVGQFDLGFGSVSGNSYNPLNFLEVLKSDNSSGFTLNWGTDTDTVDGTIVWDNKVWSFAGLWQAADTGAFVVDGVNSSLAPQVAKIDRTKPFCAAVANEDGSVTFTLNIVETVIDAETYGDITSICLFACSDGTYGDYTETYVTKWVKDDETGEITRNEAWVENADGTISVTFDAETIAAWKVAFPDPYAQGIDVYYTPTICGSDGSESFWNTVWSNLLP